MASTADALGAIGIHEGYPAKRIELAGVLESVGVGAEEVGLLHEWIRERYEERPSQLRVLASLLRDAGQIKLVIEDIRKCRALRPKPERQVNHLPNMPVGTLSCDCDGCVAFRARFSSTSP